MNPSLPPKKRESRQGSSDQRPPEDDFKYPAPLRTRRHHPSDEQEREPQSEKDLFPPPPPPPPLQPLPLTLSWQMPYHSSTHHPYLSGQVRDRRGSGSLSWRDGSNMRRVDGGLEPPIPHHSRWLQRDVTPLALHPPISVPAYKNTYAVDSRDIWPYFSPTRRDYAPPLFSSSSVSSQLFAQPSIYHHDLLSEGRYSNRRPNGLDGQGRRPEAGGRPDGTDNQSRRSPSERKNSQEDVARHSSRRVMSQEGPNSHSFLYDSDSLGNPKPPHTYTSESQTGKHIASHEPSTGSASQSGAQIYYALGSLHPSANRNPQAHPNPSGPPPSSLRNSRHSPHGQDNSHRAHREEELSPRSYQTSESILSGLDPPTSSILPHFAKGSLIELAGGHLKRVEELQTEDFFLSADTSPEFHLSTCTIQVIQPGPADGFKNLQVLLADRNTQESLVVLEEYPFFVQERGWSSCSPRRSAQLYGLHCRQLSSGDICLALTPTPTSLPTTTASLAPQPSSAKVPLTLKPSSLPPTTTPSTSSSISLRQRQCSRGSAESDRLAPHHVPANVSDVQRGIEDRPRPRKRRWSAPELRQENTDLPQGCKRLRQQ